MSGPGTTSHRQRLRAVKSDASFWDFSFPPSSILSVFGAYFLFATGTIFIVKVCLPHEQSVAGLLFQTMTQLGTALDRTITTIVFNRVRASQSQDFAVAVNVMGTNAPPSVNVKAYQAAEWAAFGFGILGGMFLASFLHGVGIVGHPDHPKSSTDEHVKMLTLDYEKAEMDYNGAHDAHIRLKAISAFQDDTYIMPAAILYPCSNLFRYLTLSLVLVCHHILVGH
ncbi:hypothetical protein EWM64_g7503 [Hericium alpestre]|uniref:Uncharacterized protein n=1 Tax=Hericium alpestre TaxID=135208 RepID=A0A4Y9ZQK7_9AGAM|nr:hypothetical protein EWM64_g7503 [Hericium alpestre]